MQKYPFDINELNDVGRYAFIPGPYGMSIAPARKFATPITPKENILRVYRGEQPVWLPNITVDCNMVQPEVMPDAYARNHGGTDWFGIEWQYEPNTAAGMVKPGTRRLSSITNWEKEIVWPDLNAIDWEKDYNDNYASIIDPDRATMFMVVNGLFERTADLTSFADTFEYLLEEPEALTSFYDRLVDWHIELFKIAKKYYNADIITFHDDMGSQKNSFMSPATFRELLLPQYTKLNKAAHDIGLYVNFHSCGSIANMVPMYKEAGFDSWEGQDGVNDKISIMNVTGGKPAQLALMMFVPGMDETTMDAMIDATLEGVAKDRRFIAWSVELDPTRGDLALEKIYERSRIFYNK